MFDIVITAEIRRLLQWAGECEDIDVDAQEEAAKLAKRAVAPFFSLQRILKSVKEDVGPQAPGLLEAAAAARINLDPPQPPRPRSPRFAAHMEALQVALDNKRYADMVADVTEKERSVEEQRNAVLPTARLQMSFGLHVIVMMGTFFALGYLGLKYATKSTIWAAVGGAVGMTGALLLETLLLIIRMNRPKPLSERMPYLTDPHKKRKPDAVLWAWSPAEGEGQLQETAPADPRTKKEQ